MDGNRVCHNMPDNFLKFAIKFLHYWYLCYKTELSNCLSSESLKTLNFFVPLFVTFVHNIYDAESYVGFWVFFSPEHPFCSVPKTMHEREELRMSDRVWNFQVLYLDITTQINCQETHFSLWGWLSIRTSCPEASWNLHPWKYSKAVWS